MTCFHRKLALMNCLKSTVYLYCFLITKAKFGETLVNHLVVTPIFQQPIDQNQPCNDAVKQVAPRFRPKSCLVTVQTRVVYQSYIVDVSPTEMEQLYGTFMDSDDEPCTNIALASHSTTSLTSMKTTNMYNLS